MMRITERAHDAIKGVVRAGDLVVDATVGNGHDTLFLAGLVGPAGRVIGLDIQDQALQSARLRVGHLPQVTLVHGGHEHLADTVAEHLPAGMAATDSTAVGSVAAAMFNLGYLPGSSKAITTRPETTIAGLDQALALLRPGGLVTLVLYTGHAEGGEEAEAVRAHAQDLGPDFRVTRHARSDTPNAEGDNARKPAPELLVIERIDEAAAASIDPLP